MRIALGVEYDGSQYHGWQSQTGLHTIQQAVETAISKVADDSLSVVCAGRTDTGVHATNQVIHFDSDKERTIRAWIYGTNSFLPKDICIKWGKEMPDDFHARYSLYPGAIAMLFIMEVSGLPCCDRLSPGNTVNWITAQCIRVRSI